MGNQTQTLAQERSKFMPKTETREQTQDAPFFIEQQMREMREAQAQKAQLRASIPREIAVMEEELRQGPKQKLSKAQRESWQKDMRERIAAKREQAAGLLREEKTFFDPAHQMMDGMESDIRRLREESGESGDIGDTLGAAVYERIASEGGFAPGQLFDSSPAGAQDVPAPLFEMLTALLSQSPAAFTEGRARQMNAAYQQLEAPGRSALSGYLDDAGAMDPQSNYIFLIYSVALALESHIDRLPANTVNKEQFSRLYALTATLGLAAGTLQAQQSFQEKRAANLDSIEQRRKGAAKSHAEAAAAEVWRRRDTKTQKLIGDELGKNEAAWSTEQRIDYLAGHWEKAEESEAMRKWIDERIESEVEQDRKRTASPGESKTAAGIADEMKKRQEDIEAKVKQAQSQMGLTAPERLKAYAEIEKGVQEREAQLDALTKKKESLKDKDRLTPKGKEALGKLYEARLRALSEQGKFLEDAAGTLRMAHLGRSIGRRVSADRETRGSAGQLEKKISSAALPAGRLKDILGQLRKDGPLSENDRSALAANIKLFAGQKLLQGADFQAVLKKLGEPDSMLAAKDKLLLLGAAGGIVTAEDRDALLPEMKKASAEALHALREDVGRAIVDGDKSGPWIIAPVGLRVVGETIAALRRQAQQALLPADLAAFSAELDKLVRDRTDALEKSALEPGKQALLKPGEAYEGSRKQTMDLLMKDTSLHAGFAETLGGLADADFAALLDALRGDPAYAAKKLDDILLPYPELDSVALLLKQKILMGSYALDAGKQKAAPLYRLGTAGERPDEKPDANLEKAAYQLQSEHDGRRLARVCRTLAMNGLAPKSDEKVRAAQLEKLNKMSDLDLVSHMISQEGNLGEKQAPAEMARLWIRTYALLLGAERGKPQTAKEMREQPALAKRGYSEAYLESALKVDITDESGYASARDVLKGEMNIWDSDRLGNRFWNFIGDLRGKDMSDERLGWKGLESLLHSEGYMEAEEILRSRSRKALDMKTGASIDVGMPEVLKKIVVLPAFFGGDGGLALARAGAAAEYIKEKEESKKTGKKEDKQAERRGLPLSAQSLESVEAVLKAERGAENVKKEGATLAMGLLGAEKLIDDIMACNDDAEMAGLQEQLGLIAKKLPQHFDPLAMLKARVHKKDDGEEAEHKEKIKTLREEIRGGLGEIATVKSHDSKGKAAKLKELFAKNDIHARAEAASALKDNEETLKTKARKALGLGKEEKSPLLDYLVKEQYAILGRDRIVEEKPEDVLTGKMSENLRIAAEVGILRVFQEQVVSFGDFFDDLSKPDSAAFMASVKRLSDTLKTATFSAKGGGKTAPLAGASSKADALAEYMVKTFIEHVRKNGGKEEFLKKQAEDAKIVHEEALLAKDQGRAAGKALGAVKKQDTLGHLMDKLTDKRSISLKSITSAGATAEAEISELDAEFSLDVAMSNAVTIQQEGGIFSVYLNEKFSGEVGAKAGYDVVGLVSLEAGVKVDAAKTKGLKLDFEDKKQCTNFLIALLGAKAPSETQKTPDLDERDQMLQMSSKISAIRQYEGGLKVEAGISKGELLEKAFDAAKTARDLKDAVTGAEKDQREAVDFSLAASLYAGAAHRVEQIGPDRRLVRDTAKAKAEASISGTFFGDEQKKEAEATFEATLERRFTGEKLTGAKMTRTYKIGDKDDNQTSAQKAATAKKQTAEILKSYHVSNASLLSDIENELFDFNDLTLVMDAELTGEGLAQYEKADGAVARMACLSDRGNYRNTIVTAEVSVTARKAGWSVEKKVGVEALGEGGGITGRFSKTSEGEIRQGFAYRAH
jgi:hypothetical protein